MPEPRVATDDDSAPPSGLVEAVLAYEAALGANDPGSTRRAL